MNSSGSLWVIACLVTALTAYFQRVTGPTYPMSGTVNFGDVKIEYHLPRSHDCGTSAPLRITTVDTAVRGYVEWRFYKSNEKWNRIDLSCDSVGLIAGLPSQPPAGKLEYRVILTRVEEIAVVPAEGSIVIRFKGSVPTAVLIIHIAIMFAAMLFSARAGLDFFGGDGTKLRALIGWTLALTLAGGFILGPIVQHYAFDAWWTGWPSGTDLTDTKTLVMLIAWVGAAIALRKAKRPTAWALAAAIVTFIVFLIPHSLFGSELDQTSSNQMKTKTDSVRLKEKLP